MRDLLSGLAIALIIHSLDPSLITQLIVIHSLDRLISLETETFS